METVCQGEHSPPSIVDMLPLIDLKSTDESCVYSLLLFICEQAKQLGVNPCVTLDQLLWLKAVQIAHEQNLDIVCRLVGFHTQCSFMGAIGNVMAGSGIEQILTLVYGAETVQHVLSGKAYARAVCAHCLLERALMNQLLTEAMSSCEENDIMECEWDVIKAFVGDLYLYLYLN